MGVLCTWVKLLTDMHIFTKTDAYRSALLVFNHVVTLSFQA